MDKGTILAIAVIVLILAVIFGTIFYLSRFFGVKLPVINTSINPTQVEIVNPNDQNSLPSDNLPPNSNPQSSIPQTGGVLGIATYMVGGLQIQYPQNWGLLTCSDSKNFELDPTSSNRLQIDCSDAIKAVTVLVNTSLNCQGQTINLGVNRVIKQTKDNVFIRGLGYKKEYRWCVSATGVNFDITHRVSDQGYTASSKQDYSSQVEQIISNIHSTIPTK